MHTDNQSIQSTNKKRTREENELEDVPQSEKHPKLDLNNSAIQIDNDEKNNPQLIERELVDINSNVYRSYVRNLYLDVIWQNEIPKKKFESDLNMKETISNREGVEYFLSLSNIIFSGTMSSSLIFAFQNEKGLSKDDFENDLKTIETTILNDYNLQSQKEIFAKPANVTKINMKLGKSNVNSQYIDNKFPEDIQIDISNHADITNSFNDNKNSNQDVVKESNGNEDNGALENSQAPQSQHTISDNPNDSNCESGNNISEDSIVLSDSAHSIGTSSETTNGSNKSKNYGIDAAYCNDYYNSNCSSQATQIQENAYTSKISDGVSNELLKVLKGLYHEAKKNQDANEELKDNTNKYNKSDNDNNDFNKITFDISITITVVNFKTVTFNFKEVKKGEILLKEIPLNTFFYAAILPKEDPKLIVELSIKKNHNYDTGFTGIINQAMTCYMNSMLQTLNILGYFKQALFQVPVENSDISTNSVLYSLQRLFYDLLTEDEPVSTNRLTKSFGWSDDQIFIQHDVQEFNLLLCDILENRMKGTQSEGTFKYLFEGKIQNCIDCIDIDYHSNKVESFCDLQLTVKGCKSIYESFNKYTEEEIMDGEDKYHTDEYGKQKARKFIKFLNFPPVLILQLKRFEYNPRKDQMDKINDYFQFYEEIDLSQYKALNPNDDNVSMKNTEDEKYSLHSIVVHRGNINNGHYFAYIRPYKDDKWYNFNDEIVREADYDEVFRCNYGGPAEIYKHKDRGMVSKINSRQEGNAYILVYIKNSLRNEILKNVTVLDIPAETRELIEKEKAYERKRKEEILRKTRNMDIYLLSKQDIINYHGLGVTPSILEVEKEENLYELHDTTLNVPKDLGLKDFRKFVSLNTGIPEQFLLIFTFALLDSNKITNRFKFKMNHLNDDIIENKTMIDLKYMFYDSKFILKDIFLYIECKFPENFLINYQIMRKNEDLQNGETEFEFNNESKSIKIYINNQNKMKFNYNQDLLEKFDFNLHQDEISAKIKQIYFNQIELTSDPQSSYKLIFFKLADVLATSIKIDQIIPILFNESVDSEIESYKEKYKALLKTEMASTYDKERIFNLYEVEFLLEKSSGSYNRSNRIQILTEPESSENNKCRDTPFSFSEGEDDNVLEKIEEYEESDLLVRIDKFSDVCLQNNDNDAFVLIPFFKHKKSDSSNQFNVETVSFHNNYFLNSHHKEFTFNLVRRIWDLEFNFLYLAVYYIKNQNTEIAIKHKKFAFILSESPETIQKRLFNYISENNNYLIKELLRENLESFILDDKKQLHRQDDFIETLSHQNLFIYNFKVHQNFNSEINKYPLLKYIGFTRQQTSHKIDFRIELIKPGLESDFDLQLFTLYDIDNNPFAKLKMYLPNGLRICEEIVKYIYDEVITKFKKYSNIPEKNFYFIIQNEKASLAYDLFSIRSSNLLQYKYLNYISIEYRLQPYTDEEIEMMYCDDNQKIYCAFVTKEGKVACDSIVFYIKSNITVKEIKMYILEKMNKIERLMMSYGEITLKKVKFYTYSLNDYNPVKDILLLNNKDGELILNYFKRGNANNLLVEFLVPDGNTNKLDGENSNGFLNDSLSLKQNFHS